ncbi:DEAD/DEAH box helicase family protein [bacterium]|nr:DEAD/DEAH box helicase family protein [bacterium]
MPDLKHLYELLADRVAAWREQGYPCDAHPAIADILGFQRTDEGAGLRFLRKPQLQSLETYWYLRLVKGTPHTVKLYSDLYADAAELLAALGADHPDLLKYALGHGGLDGLWEKISTDDEFARKYRLEALRETLALDYPSYILALAMGAGKTILIGAIIATEFGMALEYPDGDFVQNALVFAPGKTIIEALRPLADIPYDCVLPGYLYQRFSPNVKLTFTQDGDPDIPVQEGSTLNIVVTNTEKIRIQKETVRKADLGIIRLVSPEQEEAAKAEVANRRLRKIASLPHLAIFSDEAHHTYGQPLATGLKRVRQTVDYLAANTNLICAVNTTGTPYFQRQMLKDVIVWYGLSQGIRDGYLKELSDSIFSYDFDNAHTQDFIGEVIRDFFTEYRDHCLPNGAPARLAIYFPQTDDIEELRPAVDAALLQAGQPTTLCLKRTNESTPDEKDAFERLSRDPGAPHRVMLLVNIGTEGWDCPSLFACALARRLTSTNFVLQAATRCLRQVPGNTRKARVYLSSDNVDILDRQLQENYGERLNDLLNRSQQATGTARLVVRKTSIAPLRVRQIVRTVVPKPLAADTHISFTPPTVTEQSLERAAFTLDEHARNHVMQQVGDSVRIETPVEVTSLYASAVDLAGLYRRELWPLYDALRAAYPGQDGLPTSHLSFLARQLEAQTRAYEVREETVEKALALVRLDTRAFEQETGDDGSLQYTTEITYPLSSQHLLVKYEDLRDRAGELAFHYTPYFFDSEPEESFLDQMLSYLGQRLEEVEDVYFTGALTDPAKTDFYITYQGLDGRTHSYTPDFVIRRKDGRTVIVEIKRERERLHPVDGEKGVKAEAAREWEGTNPGRIAYEMIFTSTEAITYNQTGKVRRRFEETTGSDT